PFAVRAPSPPVEEAEDGELRKGLVELRRMDREIERHSHQRVRYRIGKRHRPRTVALHAPATTRRKAADAADSVSQRDCGSEHVGGLPARKSADVFAPAIALGHGI